MKLSEITVADHPVLRSIRFDFRGDTGEPANAIIIAGENGCGKSALLNLISEAFKFEFRDKRTSEIISTIVQLDRDELRELLRLSKDFQASINAPLESISETDLTHRVLITLDRRKAGTWDQFSMALLGHSKDYPIRGDFFADRASRVYFKTIFSSAEINFEHSDINSVTTQDIDREYNAAITSSGNLATQITQLLIDIQALDDASLSSWVRNNPGKAPPEGAADVRMSRFKRAFDFMFPNKKYVGVSNGNSGKEVEFSEANRTMTINKLSSGEKQIVFRGSFLLKDRDSLKGCIALIDEPEISLHPNWQLRIVEFYRKLFQDNNQKQAAQIFFATHSPFVIHNAVDEHIIVLEKDDAGAPRIALSPTFPGFSNSRAIERAFNFSDALPKLSKDVILLVEGPSDEIIIDAAWGALRVDERPFDIVNALCASHIRSLLQRSDIYERHKEKRFIGLFDFDASYNEWNGLKKWPIKEASEAAGLRRQHPIHDGIAMLLPIPAHRISFASKELGSRSTFSIEFLFDDSDIPPEFLGLRSIAQTTNKERYFLDSKKMEFAELTRSFSADKFKHFSSLVEALSHIATA